MAVSTGTFNTPTSTGNMDIAHGLGVAPVAMLFCIGTVQNLSGFSANAFIGLGMTDGTTSFSVGYASDGGVTTSNASSGRRADPLVRIGWGELADIIATFVSWDATNIRLNFTAVQATAWRVNFVAIGGAGVQGKVIQWATGTATGSLAITGVGFKPDASIHIHDGVENTTVPAQFADAHIGIGAADDITQFYVYGRAEDNVPDSITWGDQDSDAILWKCNHLGTEDGKIAHTSFDADGETVNRITATASSMSVGALFIRGIQMDVLYFDKTTSTSVPVTQDVTCLFQPVAILSVSSGQNEGTLGYNRFYVGVSNGTTEGTLGVSDYDNVGTTAAYSYISTTKGFVLPDDSGGGGSGQGVAASADITFSNKKVTYTWDVSDIQPDPIGAIAFGPESSRGGGKGGGKPPKGHQGANHWPYSIGHEGEEMY